MIGAPEGGIFAGAACRTVAVASKQSPAMTKRFILMLGTFPTAWLKNALFDKLFLHVGQTIFRGACSQKCRVKHPGADCSARRATPREISTTLYS
jgi:hypothetical protein